jgi:hypothetical protein
MTDNDKDIFAEIAEEGYDSQLGVEETTFKKFPPMITYKVANPNPRAAGEFKPGIAIIATEKDSSGERKVIESSVVDKVRAVFLFTQDCRSYFARDGLKCASDDGVFPADRIKDKICAKLDADGVAAVLSKFKGYDETRIKLVTQELTQDTGKLCQCSIKARSGFIPVCPASRGSETLAGAYVPAPCKQQVFVAAYDIDRKRVFYMNLGGKSIQANNKFISPYHEFRNFIADKKVPFYAVAVELTAEKDGDFYILGVSKIAPIKQKENRLEMKKLAEDELARYVKRSCKQEEKLVVDKIVGSIEKPAVAEELPEEDDINF